MSPKEEILVNRNVNKALAQKFPDVGNVKKTDAIKLLEAWLALGGHNLLSGFLWELKTDGAFMALKVDKKLFIALPKIVGVEIDQLYCPSLLEYWHKITAVEIPTPVIIKRPVIAKKPEVKKIPEQNPVSDTSPPLNINSATEDKADADHKSGSGANSPDIDPSATGNNLAEITKTAAALSARRKRAALAQADSSDAATNRSNGKAPAQPLQNQSRVKPTNETQPIAPELKPSDHSDFIRDRFICTMTEPSDTARSWLRCTGEIQKSLPGKKSKPYCPYHLTGNYASRVAKKELTAVEVALKLHQASAALRALTSLKASEPKVTG